jgi:hypothetical protein
VTASAITNGMNARKGFIHASFRLLYSVHDADGEATATFIVILCRLAQRLVGTIRHPLP